MANYVEIHVPGADAPHCRQCGRVVTQLTARPTGDPRDAQYIITILCPVCQRRRFAETVPEPETAQAEADSRQR